MSELMGFDPEKYASLGSSFDEPDPFAPTPIAPTPIAPTAIVKPSVASEKEPTKQTALEDLPSFLDNLYVGTKQEVADLGVGQTFDPLRTGNTAAQGTYGMAVSDINTGFETDVTEYIKDNDIPLTKEIDGKTYHLTVGKSLNDLVHGRVSDGIWIDQGPVGTYSTVYQDTSTSFATGLLNNPVMSIAASLAGPVGTLALTAAKAANGQTLHGMDYASAALSGFELSKTLQAPATAAKAAEAGSKAMEATAAAGNTSFEAMTNAANTAESAALTGKGFTILGKQLSYNASKGLINAVAVGDPKAAILGTFGGELVEKGLDGVGLTADVINNSGIQYDDFTAGLTKVVEEVGNGRDIDEALALGLGKYIREGGTLGAGTADTLAGVVRDVVRPLGKAATELYRLLPKSFPDLPKGLGVDIDTSAIEEFLSEANKSARKKLSAADTAARKALTQLDEGLYDIQSPFSTPQFNSPELPDINLPSFNLDFGFNSGSGMLSGVTTGKIFGDELFEFKNKIKLTEYGPMFQEQEVDIEDFLTSPFESAFTTSQRFA